MSDRRNTRRRKAIPVNDVIESICLDSPQKPTLLSQIDNLSPASSPLKGPLVEDDTDTGSTSFAARCFYGFKSSSSAFTKENQTSPKRNVRNKQPYEERRPTIVQDGRLNEKLLERIAASPIKQAVLQRCTIEEFRKLYRDEIKEIEQEEKLSERRITRKLSKIVGKQNDYSDDRSEGWDYSSNSEDGIEFKISNRGFDVDSVNTSSSSIKTHDELTPIKREKSQSAATPKNVRYAVGQETAPMKTPTSTSVRKFFKSKSEGIMAGTSNVRLGKGFDLKFIHPSRSNSAKKKSTKLTPKATSSKKSLAEKLRLLCQSSLDASNSTPSSGESSQKTTSPHIPLCPQSTTLQDKNMGKYAGDDFDVEDLDLVVNKQAMKTYEPSPKRQRLDYSSGNESPYDSLSDFSPEDKEKCRENVDQQSTENILNNSCGQSSDSAVKSMDAESPSCTKWFPIFRKSRQPSSSKTSDSPSIKKLSNVLQKLGKGDQSQMIIDAGQKKNFGPTQCPVCGMIYCPSDLTDRTAHAKFHRRLLEVLKFPGWKKERVVLEIPYDCARIVMILGDDPAPQRKKVEDIYEVMGRELGFPGEKAFKNPYQKVFLYVSVQKEVEGCLVAEPIKEGNRVIPGDLDSHDASGRRPWCCEKVPEPALIGISRLWVAARNRRGGVASRLMQAVQQWFDYGSLIPKDKIAFSDPTPDGWRFARRFFGTPTFLVYKYKA